jgi:Family of unknown function (DUF6166)
LASRWNRLSLRVLRHIAGQELESHGTLSNGQIRLLPPRNDLHDHSPNGFSWGYSGSGPAELSLAMLMQVFQDWSRVQSIYQIFKERFIAHIPQHPNWTANGADVYALALQIEAQLK